MFIEFERNENYLWVSLIYCIIFKLNSTELCDLVWSDEKKVIDIYMVSYFNLQIQLSLLSKLFVI